MATRIEEEEVVEKRKMAGSERERRMRLVMKEVTRRGRKEVATERSADGSFTGRPKKPWKTLWVMEARANKEKKTTKRKKRRKGMGRDKEREVVRVRVRVWGWGRVWRRRMWTWEEC